MKGFHHEIEIGRRFKFVRGTLLMLAIVALWGIPALIRTHGEFFRIGIGRHVIGRSVGAMEGHGANSLGIYLLLLPFYLITIFVSFFPWSIKLPWLVRRTCQNRDWADNYLITGAAIIFLIFSLIKTKLPHYTLPAFPLLSLLLARKLPPVEISTDSKLDGLKPSSFRWLAGATVAFYLIIALVVPPLVAGFFPAYTLSRESRDYLRPEMEFGAVNYQEPSLVWYFRSTVRGWMSPLKQKNAAEFMNKDGQRFVILPTADVGKILTNAPPNWKTVSVIGFNVASPHLTFRFWQWPWLEAKHVDLTLVLKPE
jgi:4-amino-4-deoxy-L-arabinose transferase-like glycosyltransferase